MDWHKNIDVTYAVTKRWFLSLNIIALPISLFYNAPFGRFATPNSIFAIDGIKSWIIMELASPVAFFTALLTHPLSSKDFPVPFIGGNRIVPQAVLAGLFTIHYFNRALVSPLRTPSRSPSHPLVVVAAISFNITNGFLLGTYLSSSSAADFLDGAYQTPLFWLGVALWTVGFAGNVTHDEILLNIRRKARAKGKASSNKQGEYYAIPTGLLYSYISYPNYFTEWIEWIGFALAAAPPPSLAKLPLHETITAILRNRASLMPLLLPFVDSITPPWAFLISEITVMLPRAIRGHWWYLDRFGDAYPRERRIIIPFIL